MMRREETVAAVDFFTLTQKAEALRGAIDVATRHAQRIHTYLGTPLPESVPSPALKEPRPEPVLTLEVLLARAYAELHELIGILDRCENHVGQAMQGPSQAVNYGGSGAPPRPAHPAY